MYRPLGMANYLADRGWDVTVVTADERFFDDVTDSSDPALVDQIDPRVVVERVRMPREWMIQNVRTMTKRHAAYPRAYSGYGWLRQKLIFPGRYEAWFRPALRRMRAVHKRKAASVVVATGNPWTAFRVAQAFGTRAHVPYVADFRDGWTLDQFNERALFDEGSRECAWERKLLAASALTTFVNAPMRDWYAEQYPDLAERMIVLENGVDADTLGDMPFRKPHADQPLRFGYVGTITRHLPHAATWVAWERAKDGLGVAGATAHLYGHLGFFAADRADVMSLLPHRPDARVTWEGAVSKTEVGGVYRGLDVLLMMIPSSRFVTAGKSYESMASGKPIVAIHEPDTAASEPLRDYPLWFPVSSVEPGAIAEAMTKAATAARSTTAAQHDDALKHAAKYDRRALLEPFERELRALIHDH